MRVKAKGKRTSGAAGDPLVFRLFNEIGIIEQLSRTLFERVMPRGMTLPQFTVLNHFVRLGGVRSPAQLASAFQVTKQTMTSTLARLQAAGLVEIGPNPEDGRSKLVRITPKGTAMRQRCLEALTPALEEIAILIPRTDQDMLLPPLIRLRQLLDARRSDPKLQRSPAARRPRSES